MAYVTFDISPATGSGADVQDSSSVTLGAGEIAMVRFTNFAGSASAYFGITRNGVTSYTPISSMLDGSTLEEADARTQSTAMAVPGDVVFVRVRLNGGAYSAVSGILEAKVDAGFETQPVQGTITSMALAAGVPMALDLSTFSGAKIQTAGFSADSVLVEQSMDGLVWTAAYLMRDDATAPFAATALAVNGGFSVYGFRGQLRFTRTGSADTLTIKVRGTN